MHDPRFDVTTFGEMLLRLSVPSGERLQNARTLDIHPAGAEANVVTLLSRLDRKHIGQARCPTTRSDNWQSVPCVWRV